MTDLRTAAQQMLEALEGGADSWQLVGPAIDALKAALAEPVQEPDSPERRCGGPGCDGTCCQPVQEPVAWSHINGTSDTKWHPPQRKPVAWDGNCVLGHCNSPAGCENSGECRAVERAHGIKE